LFTVVFGTFIQTVKSPLYIKPTTNFGKIKFKEISQEINKSETTKKLGWKITVFWQCQIKNRVLFEKR